MTKYQQAAELIEKRIADARLRPGDPLPSERQLAGELGLAYGTIRLAYDYLFRRGIIDRQQGRGTFVADPNREAGKLCGRLGLLAVEMHGYESPFLRHLTYEVQRLACQADCELTIDQLNMQDVAAGRLPTMLQRRSVDGYFVYGRVRDYHVRLLDEQALPYVLVGNRPVPSSTPQVTLEIESMVYQITTLLLKAGREPIWLDADPTNVGYEVGQQTLRGYTRAMREAGLESIHLNSLNIDRIEQVADELARSDLSRAAYFVMDWSSVLLHGSLARRSSQADSMWIVPMPHEELCSVLRGPTVAEWNRTINMGDLAKPAFEQLHACIRDKRSRPASVQIDLRCQMKVVDGRPRFSLELEPRVLDVTPGKRRRKATTPTPLGSWLS